MNSNTNNQSRPRTLLFIPCYNCADQVTRVIERVRGLDSPFFDFVMVVDNQSPDNTIKAAAKAMEGFDIPWIVWRNSDNYGLGGSHKAAMSYACNNDFDYLIVLHGDDQADISDLIMPMAEGIPYNLDCYLGSRFAKGAKLQGYSKFRTFGNRIFNSLFSLTIGRRIEDLGSGLNVYKTSALDLEQIKRFPNNLTFNYCMLMWSYYDKQTVEYFPILWREEDQVSNVKLFSQARRVLGLLVSRRLSGKAFFSKDHREIKFDEYTGAVVHSGGVPAEAIS